MHSQIENHHLGWNMLNVLINNRYHIEAELGRGGMGIVYRANDNLLERKVAVKLMWTNSLGSQGKARLLREAQAAARLNHPNIINIFDAGDSDGMSYIVMELLDGESLFDHRPENLEEILEVLRQICDALDHAHQNGIIHRDLKPENVIVTSQGVAKLTDFGLSRSATSRISQEGVIVGTVYYLAPEQALRQEIDHRADLYALGVLMYELVTGRLPFTADDPLGVISQHLNAPPVPPSAYKPDLPAALDQLILHLLNKRPEDRPKSATDVRFVLDNLLDNPQLVQATGTAVLTPLDRLVRGRLVGRQAEIDQVKNLWRGILSGESRSNILVISGNSGIGKTPLVKEIRSLSQVTGGRTLTGECYASGAAPFGPFIQILRQAAPFPNDLPELVLADLQTIVPDLVAQPIPDNPPLSNISEQQRLFESLFITLSAIAERQPLVFTVEDTQWADGNSLFLIRHLARRCHSTHLKMMIVLTYRPDELEDNQALKDILLDLKRERLSTTIELLPFNREQTRELLKVMFMEEIEDPFLDAIYTVTEGNLFFIEEICKTLIEEGRLYTENGHWQLCEIEDLEMPQSIRLALEMRINRLPPNVQDLLRLAAVIGRDFDFAVLRHACEQQDEDEMIEALEQAQRAQLIVEEKDPCCTEQGNSEVFAFAHALIPTTLRENTSNLRRHRMHRRVAAAIEAINPDDLEALAYHYSQAGDQEKTRIYTMRAGDRARKLYANAEAIKLYQEALRIVPEYHRDRFAIYQSLAQVHDVLAERDAQRQDIDAMIHLAEALDDDNLRCDALIALADLFLVTENILTREPARAAVAIAQRLKDPIREGRALRCVGWGAWVRHDYHESLNALETAVSRFRQAGLTIQAAECMHMLSLVTGMQGLGELSISQKYAEDAIQLSRQAKDPRHEAISLRRLAIMFMDSKQYEKSLETAQQALVVHRELGDRYEEGMALNTIAVILCWMNRFEEAKKLFHQSFEILCEIRSIIGIWLVFANIEWFIYRREGKIEEGLTFADQLLEQQIYIDNPYLALNILTLKATMFSILGQYQQALDLLEEVRKIAYHFAGPLVQVDRFLNTANYYADMANFSAAREALADAISMAQKLERPNDAAMVLVTDAEISRKEWEAGNLPLLRHATTQIDQAISLLRGTNWEYELAYALQVAGWISLSNNKSAQALSYTQEMVNLVRSFPVYPEGYQYVHVCALWANGRDEEAEEFLDQAYQRVMLVANQITNEDLRGSWLENVSINRQIIRDWVLNHS